MNKVKKEGESERERERKREGGGGICAPYLQLNVDNNKTNHNNR